MKKLFIACLGCWMSFLFIHVVFAVDSGGIGGRPAFPNSAIPESKQWFLYSLRPGESRDDAVIVHNNSTEAVDVLLYPADSTPSTDGGFALEQFVESRDFVGAWIKLSETKINLGPQESKTIPFTIIVPNDPKLDVGEHNGGILIQKMKPENLEQGGLQLFTRAGVRVYVTIPGEIVKKIELTQFEVSLQRDRKIYVASTTVKNSGNVSQNFTVTTKVENAYPWLNFFFRQFPLHNARSLQVLRESSFTSHFEFPKPLMGALKISSAVEYEHGEKVLTALPVSFFVLPEARVALLLIVATAFFIFALAFFLTKKNAKQKTSNKKKFR